MWRWALRAAAVACRFRNGWRRPACTAHDSFFLAESERDDARKRRVELLQPLKVAGIVSDRAGAVGDAHELKGDILHRHPGDELAPLLCIFDRDNNDRIQVSAVLVEGVSALRRQCIAMLSKLCNQTPRPAGRYVCRRFSQAVARVNRSRPVTAAPESYRRQ